MKPTLEIFKMVGNCLKLSINCSKLAGTVKNSSQTVDNCPLMFPKRSVMVLNRAKQCNAGRNSPIWSKTVRNCLQLSETGFLNWPSPSKSVQNSEKQSEIVQEANPAKALETMSTMECYCHPWPPHSTITVHKKSVFSASTRRNFAYAIRVS